MTFIAQDEVKKISILEITNFSGKYDRRDACVMPQRDEKSALGKTK